MNYILFQNDPDPGMRYEGLARFAFNCEHLGGPNNVAGQNIYNELFVPDTTLEGLRVLNQILEALIGKYSGETQQEFINLRDSLDKEIDQKTAIHLIDYIIKVINEDHADRQQPK